jgi:hypothetical protein
VLGAVLAATLRLILVLVVGTGLSHGDQPQAWQFYALVAGAMITYGLATAASVKLTPWASPR